MRSVLPAAGCVVLGGLLLASSPVAAQPADTARDATSRTLERAAAAAQRGQTERAWRILTRLSRRLEVGDERAAVALGELLPEAPAEPSERWRGRSAEVRDALVPHLEAMRGQQPPPAARLARARHLYAWALALSGDHALAIQHAAQETALQDRAASELLRRLATLAAARADLALARAALLAAHRALPQARGTLSDLGAVELALGRPRSAARRFARVLGRDPTDSDTRRDLAGAWVAAGRPDDAVAVLEPLCARHPELADAWLELAHAAREAADHGLAIRAAREAISRLAQDDARGHTALGLALASAGQSSAAAEVFAEALERDPDDLRARQGVAALTEPAQPPVRRDAAGRGRSLARQLSPP